MRALAYLFISALLIQNAQQLPWHEAEGSVTIGEDEKLSAARDRAQSDALRKAVEEANGVEVTGDTIVKNSQLASDIARTFARGDVRRWEVLESKPLPRQSDGKWYIDWIVRLRAQVVPPKNVKHDPVFIAHISLDGKNKFTEKENMAFNVEVSQDAYIHVFNVGSDESVTTLIPNRYHKDYFLRKGMTLRFPSAAEERQGIHLTAELPPGASSSKEQITVIATRHDNLLLGEDFRVAEYKVYDGKSTGLITDLKERLYNLDGADWFQASAEYEITKK